MSDGSAPEEEVITPALVQYVTDKVGDGLITGTRRMQYSNKAMHAMLHASTEAAASAAAISADKSVAERKTAVESAKRSKQVNAGIIGTITVLLARVHWVATFFTDLYDFAKDVLDNFIDGNAKSEKVLELVVRASTLLDEIEAGTFSDMIPEHLNTTFVQKFALQATATLVYDALSRNADPDVEPKLKELMRYVEFTSAALSENKDDKIVFFSPVIVVGKSATMRDDESVAWADAPHRDGSISSPYSGGGAVGGGGGTNIIHLYKSYDNKMPHAVLDLFSDTAAARSNIDSLVTLAQSFCSDTKSIPGLRDTSFSDGAKGSGEQERNLTNSIMLNLNRILHAVSVNGDVAAEKCTSMFLPDGTSEPLQASEIPTTRSELINLFRHMITADHASQRIAALQWVVLTCLTATSAGKATIQYVKPIGDPSCFSTLVACLQNAQISISDAARSSSNPLGKHAVIDGKTSIQRFLQLIPERDQRALLDAFNYLRRYDTEAARAPLTKIDFGKMGVDEFLDTIADILSTQSAQLAALSILLHPESGLSFVKSEKSASDKKGDKGKDEKAAAPPKGASKEAPKGKSKDFKFELNSKAYGSERVSAEFKSSLKTEPYKLSDDLIAKAANSAEFDRSEADSHEIKTAIAQYARDIRSSGTDARWCKEATGIFGLQTLWDACKSITPAAGAGTSSGGGSGGGGRSGKAASSGRGGHSYSTVASGGAGNSSK